MPLNSVFYFISGIVAGCLGTFLFTTKGMKFHRSGRTALPDLSSSIRIAYSGIQVLNHSFKNKLLTMEIAAKTIKLKLSDPAVIEQELYLIDQSANHLKEMVTRIQNRTKEIVLKEQPHNLRSIAEACVTEITADLPRNVRIEISPALSAVVYCDDVHMKEVFLNLLRNSIEAIGRKEGEIRIFIDQSLPGNWLSVCIRDNGPGIAEKHLSRVFEPYYTTKAGKSNLGLGLSYCYNVMKTSMGSMKINSAEGQGTSVIVSFHPKKVLVYPIGK